MAAWMALLFEAIIQELTVPYIHHVSLLEALQGWDVHHLLHWSSNHTFQEPGA